MLPLKKDSREGNFSFPQMLPQTGTVIYFLFLFLYSWGWDATSTHGWWVSFHYFIIVLILTDLKDKKKKKRHCLLQNWSSTLDLCRAWKYSITLELVAILIYFLEIITVNCLEMIFQFQKVWWIGQMVLFKNIVNYVFIISCSIPFFKFDRFDWQLQIKWL